MKNSCNNVTNIGQRPIVVTNIGGTIKDHVAFIIPNAHLPRTLQPGDYILEYSDDLSVLDENPRELWAADSLGKNWNLPKKQLKHLVKKAQERRAKSSLGFEGAS